MSPTLHDDADAAQAPGTPTDPVPGEIADQVGVDAVGDHFAMSPRESGRGDRLDRLEGFIEGLRSHGHQPWHALAAAAVHVCSVPTSAVPARASADPRQQQQFVPPRGFGLKILSLKGMKLLIERFSGKEMYEGLGAGFKDWGLRFLDELIAAQVFSSGDWPEYFKARALNRYLEGAARKYFDRMKVIWSAESPTLEHLMNRMLEVYEKEITVEQAPRMMRARKRADRTRTEQYQYLLAIATAADCSDRFVLQYICECAPPEIKRAMQTRIAGVVQII
ncbi:unnamed protein product [Phytophthora fragariaefolia]|uniref:Unnamed protein product n=1 Tax=Phytophthora fragariaefolia TaxID=1490495 RepID=A0A9W6YF07_9STRA|nr:unnamed protein product [Phytophthora fragariaefolia]